MAGNALICGGAERAAFSDESDDGEAARPSK
jgi:hypothetical protein